MCIRKRAYRFGWAVLHLMGFVMIANAQVVPAVDPLPLETQLTMHLRSLEQSWEVMQSRAKQADGVVGVGNLILPDDALMQKQLLSIQGEFRFDLFPRVRDFVDFFANRNRKSFDAVLGMSQVYQPMMDKALQQHQMPLNLRYLPIALSAMNVCAVNEDGRAGLWQLNYHVAIRYGLHCTEEVDERRDLHRSTHAALAYLRDLHAQYGDWNHAVVAFTNGPSGLSRAKGRMGGAGDFGAVYSHLPTHARDYFPAFVAACYLAHYAQSLGINGLAIQLPPNPDRIQLQAPLGFKAVSDVLKIPESQLRQLNPVCRMAYIPGLEVPIQLCLPKGYGAKFTEMRDSIYHVHARHELESQTAQEKVDLSSEPEQSPESGADAAEGGAVNPGDEEKASAWTPPAGTVPIRYTIQSGDVLGKIAQDHGVTVSQLMAANGLRSHHIKAGDVLTIHVPKSKASPTVVKLPSPEKTLPKSVKPAPSNTPVNTGNQGFVWYTVKSGDNLWLISKKYPGVTDKEIMEYNGISEKLQPGQKIKIPQKKP